MSSILVIEDEELITKLLRARLAFKGYQTAMHLNGDAALQFALREIPHLIIIDFSTPGLDGYELMQRLRAHPKSMHIPIIVVGTPQELSDKVRILDMGADMYLLKPLNDEELLAHVRRQLRRVQQYSLSPLTFLPGGVQLECALDARLKSPEPWSILYLDLDNFKAFNDVYGFLAGNDMILLVSRISQSVVYEYGNAADFVGHIGGDDFIILTTPERTTMLYQHIINRYKRESRKLYRPEDVERGSISGVDRKGRPFQFPLVSLSVGIVSDQRRYPHDEIGPLAATAKRRAKQSSDNVCHIDKMPDHSCVFSLSSSA
ncbi:response regulator [Ktedonospora formicarum]|uniref:Diguanylate cyclase response regulator n=1 Tax=Ktedonospora formicarum TaxID=2778364 RepID=A0A8J3MT20_9CHLR|nr:response regulator [Ktedonospora formicarum]GHO45431.1 hypothetical protein KSX_35940 [Ktedonospora formicarum]